MTKYQNQSFFFFLLLSAQVASPHLPSRRYRYCLEITKSPAQPRHHQLCFASSLFQFLSAFSKDPLVPRRPSPIRQAKRGRRPVKQNVETKDKRLPRACQILRFRSPVIARFPGPTSKQARGGVEPNLSWPPLPRQAASSLSWA